MSHQADLSGYLVSGSGGRGLPVVNPDGSAVSGGSSPTLISNIDTSDAGYFYFGDAVPGSANSSAVWRISRMTKSSPYLMRYAYGGAFTGIWDSRSSLTYAEAHPKRR